MTAPVRTKRDARQATESIEAAGLYWCTCPFCQRRTDMVGAKSAEARRQARNDMAAHIFVEHREPRHD